MEGNVTLITSMPRTLEFLCIDKSERKIINDYSCITLNDINKEQSPYLLVSKLAKDFHGISIFPGSIVRKKSRPNQHYLVDIFDTGEISLFKFPINNPSKFSDKADFDLMMLIQFMGFAALKLECVGHIYDELRNDYKLKIDHFRSLLY